MSRSIRSAIALATLAGMCPCAAHAQVVQTYPVGSAFTYQGKLEESGQAVTGVYDIQFQLFNGPTLLNFLQSTVVVEDVQVTNGLFTAKVDFGPLFSGAGRWIALGVRPGSSTGAFTVLADRQELTPAPYAIGLALPYSGAYSAASPLFTLNQLGAAGAMVLSATGGDTLTVTASNGAAINATSTTGGNAINAVSNSTAASIRGANAAGGVAVYGQISGASAASAAALYGYSLGSNGRGLFVRTESSTNPSNTVEIQNNGTGAALYVSNRTNRAAVFENTSVSGVNGGVLSTVAGGGIPLWAKTTGNSAAGRFEIDNAASSATALEVDTVGTGLAAKFTGGNVQVWGELHATVGTVLNRATPIGWGTIDYFQPTGLRNSSGNVTITWEANGVARVQLIGEGSPQKWVVVTSVSYDDADDDYLVVSRSSTPVAVAGQPGTGVFRIKKQCIAGCDEFVPNSYVSFVVYKGF